MNAISNIPLPQPIYMPAIHQLTGTLLCMRSKGVSSNIYEAYLTEFSKYKLHQAKILVIDIMPDFTPLSILTVSYTHLTLPTKA